MTRHDPVVRLRHMMAHAQEAMAILGDRTATEVEQDRVLQLALVRLVEIVGEAASQVPQDVRDRHPKIPWREASTTRNLLVHGYDIVRYDILCSTIREDFPGLVEELAKTLTLADNSPG